MRKVLKVIGLIGIGFVGGLLVGYTAGINEYVDFMDDLDEEDEEDDGEMIDKEIEDEFDED